MRTAHKTWPVVLALVFLPACDPAGTAESAVAPGSVVEGEVDAGCGAAGERTGRLLPTFGGSREEETIAPVTVNPCLPFPAVVDQATAFIPDSEENQQARRFVTEVRGVADRFLAAADLASCLYDADRLAIGVYQHTDHPWSVGVVVVVDRGFAAALDVAACYLTGQPVPQDQPGFGENDEPVFDFCVDAGLRERDGGSFAVITIGSSDWMCGALARAVPLA